MKCITSPALDKVEIAKYVDGEADDAVVAHIRECPYCNERAQQWTHLQNRLKKQLYRVECPSPMELGEYHLRLLPASRKLLVAQHVRECPLCRQELARLEEFMLEPVAQPDLVRSVQVMVARLLGGKEAGQKREDFSWSPAFSGLRGAGEEPFIYEADHIQIVIEVQDDVEQMGHKTLLGLVMGLESKDFAIQISQEDRMVASTSVDEIGNFILSHLAPGNYKFMLSGPSIEIHIPSLTV
jgi:hypothetical protein